MLVSLFIYLNFLGFLIVYRALAPAWKKGNSLALFTFANVTLKTAKYAKESQNKLQWKIAKSGKKLQYTQRGRNGGKNRERERKAANNRTRVSTRYLSRYLSIYLCVSVYPKWSARDAAKNKLPFDDSCKGCTVGAGRGGCCRAGRGGGRGDNEMCIELQSLLLCVPRDTKW